MRRLLPALVSLVILAAMAGYVATQGEMIDALSTVGPLHVAALVTLAFLGLIAQAQQFRAALRVSKISVGALEATGLTAVNTMANYYVPARGGAVVRAAYMVRVHAMSVTAYVMLTFVTVGTGLIVAFAAGVASIAWLSLSGADVAASQLAPYFFGVVVAVGLVVALAAALAGATAPAKRVFSRSKRLSAALVTLRDAAVAWRGEPTAALRLVAWTVVVLLMQAARLYVAFRAVGVSVNVVEMLLIGSLVSMSFVVSLTPGNLGIKEGVTVLAAALVGVPPDTALLASLVDRGAALVVAFTVGALSLGALTRRATDPGTGPREDAYPGF